jgi:glycosyltransferase involved in cell wall biosynthesis
MWGGMKVLMISKALVRGTYQRKLEELAALPEITKLTVVVPPYWKEPRAGSIKLERVFTKGYDLIVQNMALNGQFHTHFYPGLARIIKQVQPDLIHADEESFNLATYQATRLAKRFGVKAVFYNWANIYRNYPPPFNYFERFNFRHAAGAMAGNLEVEAILRRKGFNKPLVVCPQFGVDPQFFRRSIPPKEFARPGVFTIGYFGRLVPEKGLNLILEAAAKLKGDWRVVFVGKGDSQTELEELAARRNITGRVQFLPSVNSVDVPAYMSGLDVLVLPSLTRSNWKEQFGRVLIEAMACEVPLVGSDSGEIPNVIGEAGIVFPEGNVEAFAKALQSLLDDSDLRRDLAAKGLARVNAYFTQAQIANKHLELYKQCFN